MLWHKSKSPHYYSTQDKSWILKFFHTCNQKYWEVFCFLCSLRYNWLWTRLCIRLLGTAIWGNCPLQALLHGYQFLFFSLQHPGDPEMHSMINTFNTFACPWNKFNLRSWKAWTPLNYCSLKVKRNSVHIISQNIYSLFLS